jgi:TolC family type I secretion outer membrane protein
MLGTRRPLGLAAGLLLSGLFAAPASATSLEEALALAYSGNPDLAAQRAQLRATDEQVAQALSGWRPTITLSGQAGHRWTDVKGPSSGILGPPVGDFENDPLLGQARITQPIYRGGRTIAGTEAAKLNVQAGRAALAATEQQVLIDAATAYVNVLRDQAVVDLRQNNVTVLEEQKRATDARFEVGELTRTDVSQADARLSRARSALIAAQAALMQSRATYLRVIGVQAENLEQASPLSGLPESEDAAVSTAGERNPNVIAADYQEQSARRNVRAIEGEMLPEVNIVGIAQYQEEQSISSNDSESGEIRAEVTWPLYRGGATHSRIREALQTASQRRLQFVSAKRQATELAIQAWEQLQAARVQIGALEAQVEANKVALEGVQQEAEVGSRTVLDVLDAEQELLDAQVNLVTAQRDLVLASFQLRQAVGSLRAQDLDLDVDYYDEEKYYDENSGRWFGWGDYSDPEDR